jgi:chemotaxis receptor (MCP) glutamine deamidase CheD
MMEIKILARDSHKNVAGLNHNIRNHSMARSKLMEIKILASRDSHKNVPGLNQFFLDNWISSRHVHNTNK